jgi:hypothetical protein
MFIPKYYVIYYQHKYLVDTIVRVYNQLSKLIRQDLDNSVTLKLQNKSNPQVIHLAIAYLDVVSSNPKTSDFSKYTWRLVAIVWLSISSKFYELEEYIKYSNLSWTVSEFVAMEKYILINFLNWELNLLTPYHFVEIFTLMGLTFDDDMVGDQRINDTINNKVNKSMEFFCDLSAECFQLRTYLPSLIALACAIAARKMSNIEPVWNNRLQSRFKHTFKEISGASELLNTFYKYTYKNIKQKSNLLPIKSKTKNNSSSRNYHPIVKVSNPEVINRIGKENDATKVNLKHSESIKASNLPSIQAVKNKLALFMSKNSTPNDADSYINQKFLPKSASTCEFFESNFPLQKWENVKFTTNKNAPDNSEVVNLKMGRHRIRNNKSNVQNSKSGIRSESEKFEPYKIINKYRQPFHSIQNLSKMNPNMTNYSSKNFGAHLASMNYVDATTDNDSVEIRPLNRRSVDEKLKIRSLKFIQTSINQSKLSRQSHDRDANQQK